MDDAQNAGRRRRSSLVADAILTRDPPGVAALVTSGLLRTTLLRDPVSHRDPRVAAG